MSRSSRGGELGGTSCRGSVLHLGKSLLGGGSISVQQRALVSGWVRGCDVLRLLRGLEKEHVFTRRILNRSLEVQAGDFLPLMPSVLHLPLALLLEVAHEDLAYAGTHSNGMSVCAKADGSERSVHLDGLHRASAHNIEELNLPI